MSNLKSGVLCHAEGDRCLGCDHYYGRAPVCSFAPPVEQQGTPTPRTDAATAGVDFFITDSDQRAYSATDYECLRDEMKKLECELSRSREDCEKLWDAAAFLRDLKTMKEALETQRGPVLTLAGGQLDRSIIQKHYDDNKERAWSNLRAALSTMRKEEGK